MYPHDLSLVGVAISVWNAAFVGAIALGFLAFWSISRGEPGLDAPLLRFAVVVYLSAIAAQLFAYAFDANTTLRPPLGTSPWRYYFDPLAGPKTLYGVIVLMPMSVALATLGSRVRLARALDLWTAPMLVVLATARVGCFLQGCCHGARSDLLGVRFPPGSLVYWKQRSAGLIDSEAAWSLPVVATQALEATMLAALAFWAWRVRHTLRYDGNLFLAAIAAYSMFRLAIEFARADPERGIYGPLATSQWIALVVLASSGLAAWRRRAEGVVAKRGVAATRGR